MTAQLDLARWQMLTASVTGVRHAREGRENQDAVASFRAPDGAFAGVALCDGVGSEPNAAEGSREGCRAVERALANWDPARAGPQALLRLIHAIWNARLERAGLGESATTCLFAAVVTSGDVIVAQLGDGVVLYGDGEGGDVRSLQRAGGIDDPTNGLGVARAVSDWTLHVVPRPAAGFGVVLMSDGVSNNLLPGSLGEFHAIVGELFEHAERDRSRLGLELLRDWQATGEDDRSIAALWLGPPRGAPE